ncbi:hypothetical protein SUDANB121_00132 [Nocardiopsis dassonvillei]
MRGGPDAPGPAGRQRPRTPHDRRGRLRHDAGPRERESAAAVGAGELPADTVPADPARMVSAVIRGGCVPARAGAGRPRWTPPSGAVALLGAARTAARADRRPSPAGAPMTVRTGINGFGSIGRGRLRAAPRGGADVEAVSVSRHRRCRHARRTPGAGPGVRAPGRRAGRRGRDPRRRSARPRHLGARTGPHPRATGTGTSSPGRPAGSGRGRRRLPRRGRGSGGVGPPLLFGGAPAPRASGRPSPGSSGTGSRASPGTTTDGGPPTVPRSSPDASAHGAGFRWRPRGAATGTRNAVYCPPCGEPGGLEPSVTCGSPVTLSDSHSSQLSCQ